MAKKSTCVSMGFPSPVYKEVEEGAGRPHRVCPKGGNPTPSRNRLPPFLVQVGEEGRRGRGKEGPHPPPLVLFELPLGGTRHLLAAALSLP